MQRSEAILSRPRGRGEKGGTWGCKDRGARIYQRAGEVGEGKHRSAHREQMIAVHGKKRRGKVGPMLLEEGKKRAHNNNGMYEKEKGRDRPKATRIGPEGE